MDPVSALASYQANTTSIDPSAHAKLLPATASWDAILAQERSLAHQWLQANGLPETNSTGQLVLAHETPPAAVCQPTLQQNKVATEIASPSDSTGKQLSLQSFVTKPGILNRAQSVDFDSNSQRYTAVWQKPGPFDFGMVLKPALSQQMAVGESYSFESQGNTSSISRDASGRIWLQQQGGESHEMSSSDLRELLGSQITVDGVNLSIDHRGNLVLEAQGEKAIAMASVRK